MSRWIVRGGLVCVCLLVVAGCGQPSYPVMPTSTPAPVAAATVAPTEPVPTAASVVPSSTSLDVATTPAAAEPMVPPTAVPPTEEPSPTPTDSPPTPAADDPTAERTVISLPLASPLDEADQEFSAMAWWGDQLILVPQFPQRYNNQLFAIDRADILAYLRGAGFDQLPYTPIAFDDGGLSRSVTGFEGFESITFVDNWVYMTVETRPGRWMLGYLVAGKVTPDGSAIALDPGLRTPIPVQATLTNMTDESIILDGNRVLTLYEANGANVNPDPVANVFSNAMEKLTPIPFPTIEYRITDATALDADRRFWAINYFWPGDEKLEPAADPLAARFGQGPTHQRGDEVERLVEFQVADDGITLTDTPPIQLTLLPGGIPRNWEGLARIQDGDIDGFLLVTDKFPFTELGFVGRVGN